jgi:hypothetical protein
MDDSTTTIPTTYYWYSEKAATTKSQCPDSLDVLNYVVNYVVNSDGLVKSPYTLMTNSDRNTIDKVMSFYHWDDTVLVGAIGSDIPQGIPEYVARVYTVEPHLRPGKM